MLRINGQKLPKDPSTMNVEYNDLDGEAFRDAGGTMHLDYVTTKLKINLVWWALDQDQVAALSAMMAPRPLSCTFFNPFSGTVVTRQMYAGPKSVEVYQYLGNNKYLFKTYSSNLIEL